jgi:hypothetical protein
MRRNPNPIIFANDSFSSNGYRREEFSASFNFLLAHSADAEALADQTGRGASNGGAKFFIAARMANSGRGFHQPGS